MAEQDTDQRSAIVDGIRSDLEAVGGELVAEAVYEEIGYHGVLGRVPASLLHEAAEHEEVRWLQTGWVRSSMQPVKSLPSAMKATSQTS